MFLDVTLRFTLAFMLVSYLAYSSTLKMMATCSSETSVDCQRNIWRYIPEDETSRASESFNVAYAYMIPKNSALHSS
jgi:hypothetical protein